MKKQIVKDISMDISFKTTIYNKNYDFLEENDNFISQHVGEISKLRIHESKAPIKIGEFELDVLNVGLANEFKCELNEIIEYHQDRETYRELNALIKNGKFSPTKFERIILLHTLFITPEYRKMGVTQEVIEHIFKNYYTQNSIIITLVKPFQYNRIEREIYEEQMEHNFEDEYKLGEFLLRKDVELNYLKLYSLAANCGLVRIDENNLFYLPPVKIKNKIKKKLNRF